MKKRWLPFLLVGIFTVSLVGLGQAAPPAVLLWQSATLFPSSEPWKEVCLVGVGDVNGDGIPDVVGAHGQKIIFYPGKGDGAFGENVLGGFYELVRDERYPKMQVYKPAGDFSADSGALGDFDGDGDLDLAVVTLDLDENGLAKLYIFRNDGGSFTKVSSQALAGNRQGIWKVWAQDVNGDGKLDLLLANGHDGKSEIYLMYGEGKLSFRSQEKVREGAGSVFFCGDVNGDSLIDVALEEHQGVTVLLGNGKGKFSPGPRFTVGEEEEIYDAALADLNSDGLLDLVLSMGENGLVIARQTETGFELTGSYPLGDVMAIDCADLTGDGVPDALAWVYGWGYRILPGDGDGGFLGLAGEYLPHIPDSVVWTGDVNEDGRADVILIGGSATFYVVMSGGTPHGESYLPMGGSQLLAVGDIDSDGDLDLVAEGQTGIDVYLNDGTGALVRKEFASGDFDPLAAVTYGENIFIMNAGSAGASLINFSKDGDQIASYALPQDAMPVLAAGDYDGDGKEDVIAIAKQAILILWGGEKGIMRYRWRKGNLSLACGGDFNGDGRDELAIISTKEYADMYLLSFSRRRLHVLGKPLQLVALPLALASGDIDGDGISDPVAIAAEISVHKQEGEASLQAVGAELGMLLSQAGPKTYRLPDFPEGDTPWPFTGLAVGDVTGDGKADVIYSLTSGDGAYILPGNGDGSFGKATKLSVGLGPLFTGDIDENGQADLIASTLGLKPFIFIRFNGGER